jgi:cyanophycinase-like exopeptidase
MSPTGRKIHEVVFKRAHFTTPVHICILETPTGFEVNAVHSWPERMEQFFTKSLKNYNPTISRIRAWRKDGDNSTNDPKTVDQILGQDYIYSGAGSPSYTITHLKNSRAYANLISAHRNGSVLSLGSASAIAIGKYALPVYEIFKAGSDLHWLDGLDFFSMYGLKVVIIPHWNNREGEDFDTTCCWMGKSRLDILLTLLPQPIPILGIDEQTACIIDIIHKQASVLGIGSVHCIFHKTHKYYKSGSLIQFSELGCK